MFLVCQGTLSIFVVSVVVVGVVGVVGVGIAIAVCFSGISWVLVGLLFYNIVE